ncbi:MAG: CPBP family intramembrane metalloprotease [Oscillospiraceae bacterium]|nr:CPBP family intramembrane metalloprotease [Oscillospiraceae bacterium]
MKHPMTRGEAVFGWIWVFIHSLILPTFLGSILYSALIGAGVSLDEAALNVIYYGVSFVLLMLVLSRFMKASFSLLTHNIGNTFAAVLFGYTYFFAAMFAVSLIMQLVLSGELNPNQAAVDSQAKLNPNAMLAVGVFLAPVCEEVLFRGVVFGTIQRKSRAAAYIVSAVLFALYHLSGYLIEDFSWELLLMAAEYIPAGIVLAWCYERGKSVYAPIFLHMIINLVSITVTLNL